MNVVEIEREGVLAAIIAERDQMIINLYQSATMKDGEIAHLKAELEKTKTPPEE